MEYECNICEKSYIVESNDSFDDDIEFCPFCGWEINSDDELDDEIDAEDEDDFRH